MRFIPLAFALAALAISPAKSQAQDYHGSGEQPSAEGEPEATSPGLSEEQRAAYAAWPENVKAYYQSLSEKRQAMFWTLTDSDKVALATMSAPDAEAAWEMVERKAMPQPNSQPQAQVPEPIDPQPER